MYPSNFSTHDLSKASIPDSSHRLEGIASAAPENKKVSGAAVSSPAQGRGIATPELASSDRVAARFSLNNQNGALHLRVEHPVRQLLEGLQDALGEFISHNLRGATPIGLTAQRRESVQMQPMIKMLKEAFHGFERISRERGDGFAPSLAIRQVASLAAGAVEHQLIDRIVCSHDGDLPEGEVAEVLHELATLKQTLCQLTQQFDATMLEVLQDSGKLSPPPKGSKRRPAA